jgi:hypothetical protein
MYPDRTQFAANKGIQATALQRESKPVKTSATHPPHLMPQPLGLLLKQRKYKSKYVIQ